ncbi:conserved hypothetical protein [Ricinus communis]|uniref:Uncharacterized protein n=1 Tax=Ricinus communis TaxID=3988 RepID=B9RTJ0_RICCO|nr:conserved hypothetical protein [Ricinus communis]
METHVLRLLKLDMIAVHTELECQEEISLAIEMFEVIQKQEWGFLRDGSPGDGLNIYEDMKKSPDLPFRTFFKGASPGPLLRNRVKQDFEELFPEKHVYDTPGRDIWSMLKFA